MWKAIKLILIYFVMQILASLTAIPFVLLYMFITTGTIDPDAAAGLTVIPGIYLGCIYMAWYLWKKGYLTGDKALYHPTSPLIMACTIVGGAGVIWVGDWITSSLPSLPDWMGQTFQSMVGNVWGILGISLVGPVLEELLFRGGVTKELLRRYNPGMAIVLSGLLFGLFHINPAQVVGAIPIGIFFAWLYWRTGSLIPGIVVHVLNNSMCSWVIARHPEWHDMSFYSLLDNVTLYYVLLAASVLVLVATVWMINKRTTIKTKDL